MCAITRPRICKSKRTKYDSRYFYKKQCFGMKLVDDQKHCERKCYVTSFIAKTDFFLGIHLQSPFLQS